MSITRGEIAGFLRALVSEGMDQDEAKNKFENWLDKQSGAVVTEEEKRKIKSDLDSYKV